MRAAGGCEERQRRDTRCDGCAEWRFRIFIAQTKQSSVYAPPMPRLYFEDLHQGLTFQASGTPVTAEAIKAFARQFDPQPFHLDEEAAKKTPFGGLVASGWHTAAMMMRLAVDGFLSTSATIGSKGPDRVRFTKPVYAGDSLHLKATVTEVKASETRPSQGSAYFSFEVSNQRGDVVLVSSAWIMFLKKNP